MDNCHHNTKENKNDEKPTIDSVKHDKYDTSKTVQNRGIDETQTNLTGRNRFENNSDHSGNGVSNHSSSGSQTQKSDMKNDKMSASMKNGSEDQKNRDSKTSGKSADLGRPVPDEENPHAGFRNEKDVFETKNNSHTHQNMNSKAGSGAQGQNNKSTGNQSADLGRPTADEKNPHAGAKSEKEAFETKRKQN